MTSPLNTPARPRVRSRRPGAVALLAAAALGLSACGAGDAQPAASSTMSAASSSSAVAGTAASSSAPASSSATAPAGDQAAAVTVTDPWTKATDGPMTGSFGTLANSSDADLHVVSVRSEVGGVVELHQTVVGDDGQSVMQPAPDGFTVPAHGTYALAPGGSHVMLMDLTEPIEPGESVAFTLELEDGSTVDVESIARPFTGANESYHGDGAASGSADATGHADH